MKRVIAVGTALATVLALTSCAGSIVAQYNDRTANERVDIGKDYSIEDVELPDGTVLKCLWYLKGSTTGSMSCNW